MAKVRVKGLGIRDFQKRLQTLPRTVAQEVAQKATPIMTTETRAAFAEGRTVYDKARPRGVDGQALTLEQSGAIKNALRFTNEGTKIRAVLGPKNKKGVQYGRFLIGKYDILPNGPIPQKWRDQLVTLVRASATKNVKGGT